MRRLRLLKGVTSLSINNESEHTMPSNVCSFISDKKDFTLMFDNEVSMDETLLRECFRDNIENVICSGCDTFMVGSEKGADIVFAEQVIDIRTHSYPDIKLICVIPYEGQADEWSEQWRDRYFEIMEKCDDVVTLQARWSCDCYENLYQYMINASSIIIAMYDKPPQVLSNIDSKGRTLIKIDIEQFIKNSK